MSRIVDLTGKKFGRLTAISRLKGSRAIPAKWKCVCDCGETVFVDTNKLLSGHTASCGCLQRERTGNASRKHGLRHSRLYKTWCNMKTRCYNRKSTDFYNYGGRGITVCDEWKTDFLAFYNWAMSNGYRDDLSIDRIDNDKGYSPDNCRWATSKEQARNKANTVKITLCDETKSLKDWCDIYNLDYYTVYDMLRSGYQPEVIFYKKVF